MSTKYFDYTEGSKSNIPVVRGRCVHHLHEYAGYMYMTLIVREFCA
jgi:hypothetical protein